MSSPREVIFNSENKTRLNKRMSELGLASRRQADEWIAKGWVRVDGRVAEMGMQVSANARIEIDKRATGEQERQVTVLINKPMGLVSGQAEDGHTPAITLVQPKNRWQEDRARISFQGSQLKSLVPAGRLDVDSTGLLVLTQDGRIARQLIGEDAEIEKEYLVRVAYTGKSNLQAAQSASATYAHLKKPQGTLRLKAQIEPPITMVDDTEQAVMSDVKAVFPAEQLERLRHGLSLDGQPLKPARVEWVNNDQLRFVLLEGKKRQIRRMCELVGLKVLALKRVRIGKVALGNLPIGQWRYLGANEKF